MADIVALLIAFVVVAAGVSCCGWVIMDMRKNLAERRKLEPAKRRLRVTGLETRDETEREMFERRAEELEACSKPADLDVLTEKWRREDGERA